MRIDGDTKDALLFTTGLLGIIAQAILFFLGVPVSIPLVGAFLSMCGIAAAPNVLSKKSGENGDSSRKDRDRGGAGSQDG